MKQKQLFILMSLLSLTGFLLACGNDSGKKTGPDDVPSAAIKAALTADQELSVSIEIPASHHAYLDKGKDGVLIPISFDWKPLALKKNPDLIRAPAGAQDKDVQARVLRGSGEFLFKGPVAGWPKGKSFRVRSQICDENIGICFPPTYQSVSIK